jgi:hypothetical protein
MRLFSIQSSILPEKLLFTLTGNHPPRARLALVKKAMGSNLVDGNAIPLTGDSGLMMRNWLILLFSGAIQSNVFELTHFACHRCR